MAIRIKFDSTHNPLPPTLVLMTKSGKKICGLNAKKITIKDCLNAAAELSFEVHKYTDGKVDKYWNEITNFKVVWCREWNTLFEIKVDIDELDETVKTVYGTQLGVAELSQILIHSTEINTENDIEREDYVPTVLYNGEDHNGSLLHRITEKARHYQLEHVDATIANIQRTFTFDNISIYDAFQEIAQEIGCLFIINVGLDESGNIKRSYSVYDLFTNCNNCGYRGEYTDKCPKCDSIDLDYGYGEDTTIFITADELASDNISFTTDTDAVKNCFKLVGGDDLMTATIRNCNPNGTDYMWFFTEDIKKDMSDALVKKLNDYDVLNNHYQKEYVAEIDDTLLENYNALVDKYLSFKPDLEKIEKPITGFSELMTAYYNTIDFNLFLQTSLMPNASLDDTSAADQAALLTAENLSPIAVSTMSGLSQVTADNAVLGMAMAIIDSRYQVKVASSTLAIRTWTGNFTVTNYSDETDTATSKSIIVTINDDYALYVKQKIKKAIAKKVQDLSIVGLFDLDLTKFQAEIKKYSLDNISSLIDAAQSCIDVLIEQGIGNSTTWAGASPNLYDDLYYPYYQKLQALQVESKSRQSELSVITKLQDNINSIKDEIQKALDFETYLGTDLLLEFCAYRREDVFSNENYISDALDNSQLFSRALEFIETAENEIYKSAELQHSISTSLNNLLVIKKFEPLIQYFSVGNWLRIKVDDALYKLRLIEYDIDYDNIETISVEFSDVMKIANGVSDLQDLLSQAKSMASSYDYTQRQAEKATETEYFLNDWVQKGLDVTNTRIMAGANNQTQSWDEHGMLFRQYDPITDTYSDTQMKIVNSTLAVTDDGWKTVKTAVGKFYYYDPKTGELKTAYGINAELLVGKMILGESLGIYAANNSMTFDQNGLIITNKVNTFTVNPNSEKLMVLSNAEGDILWVDENGVLHISGDGAGLDISANDVLDAMNTRITQTAEQIKMEADRAQAAEEAINGTIESVKTEFHSEITQSAEEITLLVTKETERATRVEESLSGNITTVQETLSAQITLTAEQILSQVSATYITSDDFHTEYERLESKITQTAESITSEVSKKYVTTEEAEFNLETSKGYANAAEANANNATDNKLKNYPTITEAWSKIEQTAESITMEVGKKVDGTEIISTINQSAEEIKISALKISLEGLVTVNNRFKILTDGSMEATNGKFNGTVTTEAGDSKLVVGSGYITITYKDKDVGTMGGNGFAGFPDAAGINFDLRMDGDYMTWAAQAEAGGHYIMRLTYARQSFENAFTVGALNVGCDFDLNSYKLTWTGGSQVWSSAGQHLYLAGSAETDYTIHLGVHDTMWTLDPNVNGMLCLGSPNHRYGTIYANNSTIQTSDRTQKKDIAKIDDKYIDLFMLLQPVSYKFIDGTSGRTHLGFISQDVEDAMKQVGLTDLEFAGFCKDVKKVGREEKYINTRKLIGFNPNTREAETIEEEFEDTRRVDDVVYDENGDPEYSYSLRYDEFIALNTAVIQSLVRREKELQDRVSQLEAIIQNS